MIKVESISRIVAEIKELNRCMNLHMMYLYCSEIKECLKSLLVISADVHFISVTFIHFLLILIRQIWQECLLKIWMSSSSPL
jgi:hypothetical protein